MNKLILSEVDYAKRLLAHQVESKKVTNDLYILAKYYRDSGKTKNEIQEQLHNYMKVRYPRYDQIRWSGSIEAISRNVEDRNKNRLLDLQGIPVYADEIELVKSLEGKHLQNLAFTILVCGRYFHLANPNNDHWLNMTRGELFSAANISLRLDKQRDLLHKLIINNFIEMKFVRGAKVHLIYHDESSPVALVVRNMSTIGSCFRKYIGEPYLECSECGDIVKMTSNRMKLCPRCSKIRRRQYKTMKQTEYRETSKFLSFDSVDT